MIINYNFSLVGKSHIERNICCQDSNYIERLDNGWVIAAAADGVGSAKNSDIGSKIAAETVVKFCKEFMPWDYSTICIKSMLRTAYNFAYKQIMREAEKLGEPVESFDTTLTVVIYDGNRIVYGHSGDGAIIGLTTFGDYVEITKPQKGPDGISVIPLRSGYTHWEIDTYEEDLAAVLIMTDGMLDTLRPYLLRTTKTRIYTPLATFFADPKGFAAEDEAELDKIKDEIRLFLTADADYDTDSFYSRLADIYKLHIPNDYEDVINGLKRRNYPVSLMQNQQDDKTMIGLINTEARFDDKDIVFYAEPDWDALQDAWNRKAYPHMYKEQDGNGSTADTASGGTAATEQSEQSYRAVHPPLADKPLQQNDHTNEPMGWDSSAYGASYRNIYNTPPAQGASRNGTGAQRSPGGQGDKPGKKKSRMNGFFGQLEKGFSVLEDMIESAFGEGDGDNGNG